MEFLGGGRMSVMEASLSTQPLGMAFQAPPQASSTNSTALRPTCGDPPREDHLSQRQAGLLRGLPPEGRLQGLQLLHQVGGHLQERPEEAPGLVAAVPHLSNSVLRAAGEKAGQVAAGSSPSRCTARQKAKL